MPQAQSTRYNKEVKGITLKHDEYFFVPIYFSLLMSLWILFLPKIMKWILTRFLWSVAENYLVAVPLFKGKFQL